MIWYYYLQFFIYTHYLKKRNNIPAFYAFFATTTLVFLNLFVIAAAIGFVLDDKLVRIITALNTVSLVITIAFANYFLLYYNKKYEEVFNDFELFFERYKRWNLSVKLYIIFSIVLFIAVLVIADIRNHNFPGAK